MHESQKQLARIMRSGALNAKDKKRLIEAISLVKQKIPTLGKYIHNETESIASMVSKNLQLRKGNIIQNLKSELLKLNDLPSDNSIKNYLAKNGYHAVNKTQEDMGLRLTRLKEHINNWVQDNLNPVQDIINIERKSIEDPRKTLMTLIFRPWTFPPCGEGNIANISGYSDHLAAGCRVYNRRRQHVSRLHFRQRRQACERVKKTIDKIDELYSKAFADAEFQFKTNLDEQVVVLTEYANRKLKLYFSDIERQINSLNLASDFDYLSFEKTC
jgi:hypothetical protein